MSNDDWNIKDQHKKILPAKLHDRLIPSSNLPLIIHSKFNIL